MSVASTRFCAPFIMLVLQVLICAIAAVTLPRAPLAAEKRVELTIFWEPGCPYCQRAKRFLESHSASRKWLNVSAVDVSASRGAQERFLRASQLFGIERPGVPLIIIGDLHFLGFDNAERVGRAVLTAAAECRRQSCSTLAQLLERSGATSQKQEPGKTALPPSITIPLIGEVKTANLSLPVLTILLAAVDGFNPCAMWVLVFLVGLLVGVQDRIRMWLLGGAFLLTSGIVYFGFLAAWLNVFLFLGALVWVRVIVGLVAVGSGAYYLHAYVTDAAAQCRVTDISQRQRIMTALRASVTERHFLAAIAGIVVLAAAVNFVELLCSAGIPAIFTELLSMNQLPVWQYYAFLLLYVSVFMIDDVAIFATAMLTLHATSMTNQYLRYSHLIGGIGMLLIGGLLLFAPRLLTFHA